MRLIVFAIYLGIGAMLHAIFVGPYFDWQSAWTLGWLFGWPLMLVIAFSGIILTASVIIGLGWLIYMWIDAIAHWRAKRRATK